MREYADNLNFSIPGVARTIENLKELNKENEQNGTNFSEYIESSVVPVWTTERGKEQIQELRNFVENEFTDYVKYINEKIQILEEEVLPRLKIIDQA